MAALCIGTPHSLGSEDAPDPFDRPWTTGIFKAPVAGALRLSSLGFSGDGQADLTVHGGPDKAACVYCADHYPEWRRTLATDRFTFGAFGENLTIEGLLETDARIGDRISIGSAEFVVTQPRMPCFKLGLRFGRDDMVKRFLRSGRTGFYLAVLREGEVASGDPIELAERDDRGVTVADIAELYASDMENEDLLRRAIELPALPESWRGYFRKRLFEPDA